MGEIVCYLREIGKVYFGSTMALNEIDEILKSLDELVKGPAVWHRLDALIESLSDDERVQQWDRVARECETRGITSGHAHFRLGVFHLISGPDETVGIQHLQRAYEQDQKFAGRKEPHRMAAYRVLGLIKDFLDDLQRKKNQTKKNWQVDQLQVPYRRVLIATLLAVYDESTRHILDAPSLTYQHFIALFSDENLRRFAGENYFCACGLLEIVGMESGHSFLITNEYPLSRALVGLYGGVLEAILADRLRVTGTATLGYLINQAHDAGLLNPGTRLSALATALLYFRNHIHANKDIARKDYLIDINVAKSLKAATDSVVADLLQTTTL